MFADLFGSKGTSSVGFILIAFFIGIICAALMMLYQIAVPGKLVRALLRRQADCPERAANVQTLGFRSEALLRFLFKDTGALSKYVIPKEQVKKGKKTRPVMLSAQYYLIPETKERAAIRYDRKRANVLNVVAAIVLFAVVGGVLYFVIPDLIQMLENFISIVKGGT